MRMHGSSIPVDILLAAAIQWSTARVATKQNHEPHQRDRSFHISIYLSLLMTVMTADGERPGISSMRRTHPSCLPKCSKRQKKNNVTQDSHLVPHDGTS